MKKSSILFLMLCSALTVFAWGFAGHEKINEQAVFTLPPVMIDFYKKHIDFLIQRATVPDKRRYCDSSEAPRHFIDMECYPYLADKAIPPRWEEALTQYGANTLNANGILPWHINKMMVRLTAAFKKRDEAQILLLSGDLGHYIADAYVPLHTTENYNGQMTEQTGIHALWESRVPELLMEHYAFPSKKAVYIKSPFKEAWHIISESYAKLDSVLLLEKELSNQFQPDKKYSNREKGGKIQKVYSEAYILAYNSALNNMAEHRMQAAVLAVGSFWFTAWVNAGQPDLNMLHSNINLLQDEPQITDTTLMKPQKGHEDN